jgi:hypothetical protein
MQVGGFNPSEKYESQLGSLFPIYGKIKAMFQTTNQNGIYRHLSICDLLMFNKIVKTCPLMAFIWRLPGMRVPQ